MCRKSRFECHPWNQVSEGKRAKEKEKQDDDTSKRKASQDSHTRFNLVGEQASYGTCQQKEKKKQKKCRRNRRNMCTAQLKSEPIL